MTISVSDTGYSITPEAARRVFDPMYQEQIIAGSMGLGLGFYLARELSCTY